MKKVRTSKVDKDEEHKDNKPEGFAPMHGVLLELHFNVLVINGCVDGRQVG